MSKKEAVLVCISDTHGKQLGLLPEGDILVHTGDFSMTGTLPEVQGFVQWLKQQPHRLKVVIAGNHDLTLDTPFYDRRWNSFHSTKEDPARIRPLLTDPSLRASTNSLMLDAANPSFSSGIVYLENSGFTDEVTGLRFWGSPNQPEFGDGWAFANADAAAAAKVWSRIPSGTHVLMTHGPPAGVCDTNHEGNGTGCAELVKALERVKPVLHVFGHIHEGYGTAALSTGTLAINACTCDLDCQPSQPPIVVQLEIGAGSSSSSNIDVGWLVDGMSSGSNGAGKGPVSVKVTNVTKEWGT